MVRTILETYFQGTDYVELLEDVGLADTGIAAQTEENDDEAIGQSPLEDACRRLCDLAEHSSKRNAGKRVPRTSKEPIRSAPARRAVLLRSKGNCENPDCIGHPDVLTDAGDPILEIDHIHDLAKDGPDDPIQMIALCPNCHAVKTRSRDREQLRQRLFEVARQRHQDLIRRCSGGAPVPRYTWPRLSDRRIQVIRSHALHELSKPSVSWNVTQYCPMTAETDIARGQRSDRRGGGTAKTFLASAPKQPGYSRSSPVMSCAPRRFSGCRSSLTSWSQSRWKWPSWTSRASRGKSETRAQAAGPPAQGHGGGTVPGMHPGGHRVRR
jgi:hypothetical protein